MKIVIVGAGPKAAAIAARVAAWHTVLSHRETSEINIPILDVIECHAPGAAWSGRYGFSDGTLSLCNAGEKDVGFPYPSEDDLEVSAEVSREVARSYSWFAYLVASGTHAEWVHRGRLFPSHARWARYIEWVFTKTNTSVNLAEVTRVECSLVPGAPRWQVSYKTAIDSEVVEADAVVLTGTGPAIGLPGTARFEDGLVNAETYWHSSIAKKILALDEGDIVVIGSGGAAGTILAHLASLRLGRDVGVISLSPLGALFPRGDGFAERRLSSDPEAWRLLPKGVRREILARTDAGVVSTRIKDEVDRSEQITFQHGRAMSVDAPQSGSDDMVVHYQLGDAFNTVRAKVVVAAMGFDTWGLLKLLGASAACLTAPPDDSVKAFRQVIEAHVGPDLCLPVSAGLGAFLHVPVLAAFAQGPGFASLGSLGMTASAIIDPYVTT